MTIAMILLSSRIGRAETGEQDYRHYCAGCHRKGAGAPMNGATPPDLSKLAKKNGGKFPFEEVYEVIAGQREIIWHQRRPDMPYWGDVFYDEAKGSSAQRKAEVKERILRIVRYLQQIQRK
ncbi:MAG: c-type cytochrome [Candidatus Binataceae bacterium]